ncbi:MULTISPECIES: histidine kinase dimerization/phosphoacceptor domain -containing protein [unclassified Methanosarcina]|uniref:histidine kinase dimerization/phosphoacceptor domain -containing protein n=1 Tax=unclassified Methanosarcina TaxID=2644672 RepID=UPI0006157A7E|nr:MULTISPECIES: histidine kinase dimerization/phosphoacceptor domain -containing protein [unclassified Methanosarcina]AKB20059.1 Sensory transduction histidine kinase [Methanosarcina sp. WWM596]AKB21629.1 Sensory transduction histidine kinase [Methanosarcina sp. WH1]
MGGVGIVVTTVKSGKSELQWMRYLLSTSPYPAMKAGTDGILLYANEASVPLLKIWRIETGQKLPLQIHSLVRKAIRKKEALNIEVKGDKKEYLLTFKPVESGYVHIHGMDLPPMIARKKTLFKQEKQQEAFPEALMDRTAEMAASALKAEFCRIYKFSHDCIDLPENQLSIQEIGCFRQPDKLNELAGGISVFIRMQGNIGIGVTLYRTMPDEFAPEEVRFLRYVLSLVRKILKCKRIDSELQDRIHFLESLLEEIPNPAYFRDVSQTFQDLSELLAGKVAHSPDRNTSGYSMHELEEVIPKELTAIYKRKKGPGVPEEFGMMPCICGMFRESEEALKIALEVQKALWIVINNSPAVVFLWRNENKWPADFVSENVSQFGYEVEDFTSGRIHYGDIVYKEDLKNVQEELDRCVENKLESFRMEYRICTREGESRWVDERTFIQRDAEGHATHFQGVVIDITERKVAEEALARAEQLRKKEINHRIKNNLQIVSSLLDLQAEQFSDRKVIEAFKESESRIVSMSLIHEELYESGNLDILDFSSYLRKLIADLCRSYSTGSSAIRVNLNMKKVFLGVDTAVSLGIIINELFTNAIKYAFPQGKGGEINVELFEEGTGDTVNEKASSGKPLILKIPDEGQNLHEQFTLVFADNGKGFPEELNIRNTESLGLQLVNALVNQIGGSISLEREKGTKFTLKFRE